MTGLEKEDWVLVGGEQPEASKPTSLGRKLKKLWARSQGVWVPPHTHQAAGALGFLSAHHSERVTRKCQEKEVRHLCKVQDAACTLNLSCPLSSDRGDFYIWAFLSAYSVTGIF